MHLVSRIKDRARSVRPSVLLTVCLSLTEPSKLLSNKHDGDDDGGGGGTFSDGNYWCCTNISSRRPVPQFVLVQLL